MTDESRAREISDRENGLLIFLRANRNEKWRMKRWSSKCIIKNIVDRCVLKSATPTLSFQVVLLSYNRSCGRMENLTIANRSMDKGSLASQCVRDCFSCFHWNFFNRTKVWDYAETRFIIVIANDVLSMYLKKISRMQGFAYICLTHSVKD